MRGRVCGWCGELTELRDRRYKGTLRAPPRAHITIARFTARWTTGNGAGTAGFWLILHQVIDASCTSPSAAVSDPHFCPTVADLRLFRRSKGPFLQLSQVLRRGPEP